MWGGSHIQILPMLLDRENCAVCSVLPAIKALLPTSVKSSSQVTCQFFVWARSFLFLSHSIFDLFVKILLEAEGPHLIKLAEVMDVILLALLETAEGAGLF